VSFCVAPTRCFGRPVKKTNNATPKHADSVERRSERPVEQVINELGFPWSSNTRGAFFLAALTKAEDENLCGEGLRELFSRVGAWYWLGYFYTDYDFGALAFWWAWHLTACQYLMVKGHWQESTNTRNPAATGAVLKQPALTRCRAM